MCPFINIIELWSVKRKNYYAGGIFNQAVIRHLIFLPRTKVQVDKAQGSTTFK